MAQLYDNPDYTPVYTSETVGITFYIPADTSNYHKSREMAMQAQEAYNRCGISREVLQSMTAKMLEIANNQLDKDTVRTDIGILANNLNYRMTKIADEACIMQMAAIGLLCEREDPNALTDGWTKHKLRLAEQHPDIRDFFLQMGVAFSPEYATALRGLAVEEYLTERQLVLNGLTLSTTLAEQ